MRSAILLALASLLLPSLASAHPHLWISQTVRAIARDGKYTHVEIEWKFDPEASEDEIPAIDEDKDGKFSEEEIRLLVQDMMPELQKFGFMTWLNTGAKDFRPTSLPELSASIDDPAKFVPPDWNRSAGDSGMPMPANKRGGDAEAATKGPRNLVYVMRFALPEPGKFVSITTYDPDDFMRVEVDKAALPAGCTLAKHPTYKAEFIRGFPVFADIVTCRLP